MKNQLLIKFFPVVLLCYHLLFAYVGWNYVIHNDGDAIRYWLVGQDLSQVSWSSFFHPGTDMVKILTFPLVKYLHLPFWAGFLLFSLFSYYGFYRLWKLILSITAPPQLAFYIGVFLLLLPNLHIWTSLIGKESLLFVALVFMTEKLFQKKINSAVFIISFLLVALIRPHVATMLLIALMIAYFWKGNLIWKNKISFGVISAIALAGLYLMVKKIANINNNPWERIAHVYDYHIKVLKTTPAYVPLDEYSLPYKIFTFYFRPLPFEKEGILYLVQGTENLIMLGLTLFLFYVMVVNFRSIKWDFYKIFTIFVVILLAVMYVYAYANYGLIARTKIMVMPFLYLFMVKIFSENRKIAVQQDVQKELTL